MINMHKNQISFFATRNDLLSLLSDVDSSTPFEFSHQDVDGLVVVNDSADDLENLGVMLVGDQNAGQNYFLIDPGERPATRLVEQRNGKVRIIFDQRSYPKSVMLRSGGLLDGSNTIIAGQIGTVSDNLWSISLFKTFHLSVKKRFAKIKSYYVGNEAATMLDNGYRLTTNIKSPIEYDLHR